MDGSSQLETLIDTQRRAMRCYVAFTSAVAVLGLAIVGFALTSSSLAGEPLKLLLGIGGGFISSSSLFPVKELQRCQQKLTIYRGFRARWASASEQDRSRIETIVWDAVKSVALSQ